MEYLSIFGLVFQNSQPILKRLKPLYYWHVATLHVQTAKLSICLNLTFQSGSCKRLSWAERIMATLGPIHPSNIDRLSSIRELDLEGKKSVLYRNTMRARGINLFFLCSYTISFDAFSIKMKIRSPCDMKRNRKSALILYFRFLFSVLAVTSSFFSEKSKKNIPRYFLGQMNLNKRVQFLWLW